MIILWETRSVSQRRVRFDILIMVGDIRELKNGFSRWGKDVQISDVSCIILYYNFAVFHVGEEETCL